MKFPAATNAPFFFDVGCAKNFSFSSKNNLAYEANQLRSKPYRFGGGHASFLDNGYDCSGTISYMLGGAGLIRSPMSSFDLRGFGQSELRKMDHGLRAQRPHLRGHRRSAAR